MHAEALPRQAYRSDDWGRPIALAVIVHLLVVLVFTLAWLWSPRRDVEPAAGDPMLEASLEVSAAEARAARRALDETPTPAPPLPVPVPVEDVAEEDTVPPPQPIPEPRPQDSVVPPQNQAQERIPEPDTTEQERVSEMAIAQEKARQEQEARRRQEQIDLTERQRQEEAERRQRLAKQQEEADRQKKLDEIRRQRAQNQREAQLAEQKLRQLQDLRDRQAAQPSAAATTPAPAATGTPGQGGTDANLAAQYAAAIQEAVLRQWVRPDSVPLGQRCRITIRQSIGGHVVDVEVAPSCPYDDVGRRSVEAAVLRAQPLPYKGFEAVFQRTLNFNFEARDR